MFCCSRIARQRLVFGLRQWMHSPHWGEKSVTTWSPGWTKRTRRRPARRRRRPRGRAPWARSPRGRRPRRCRDPCGRRRRPRDAPAPRPPAARRARPPEPRAAHRTPRARPRGSASPFPSWSFAAVSHQSASRPARPPSLCSESDEQMGPYLAVCSMYRDHAVPARVDRVPPAGRGSSGSSCTTTAAQTTIARCWLPTASGARGAAWTSPPEVKRGAPWGLSVAFDDCLERHRRDSRWIAFIDIDEFLFSPTGKGLPDVLAGFEP